MQQSDLAGLENLNNRLFFAHLRHVSTPAEFLEIIVTKKPDGRNTLLCHGIVPPSDQTELIGFVAGLIRQASAEDPVDSLEVGYALLPAHQGRGIARAALPAFLRAVLTPQITELRAVVDPENPESIRLLQVLGFQPIGQPELSYYLGDPDNPAHYQAGILQYRPRIAYRTEAAAFR